MESNEPKITCFMCNFAFCQEETQIQPGINVVRVNCIGRIDPVVILEVFEKGADAVMLVGCKPPDCHYVEGNLQAEITAKMLKKLMALMHVEPKRLELVWHSPTDRKSFSRCLEMFSDETRKLAVSPLKSLSPESHLLIDILAAKDVVADFRLRVLLGRQRELTETVNVYGEKVPQEEFDRILDDIVEAEFIRHKIHVLTRAKPLSVKALAERVELKPTAVLKHIVNMRRKNMITVDHVEETTPFYKALEVK